MKKLLFIAIACMLFVTTSQAQIRFGVKAGATFSKFNWSSSVVDMYENNSATGFQAGIMTRIQIPIVGIAIQPELLYTSSGNDGSKLGYFQVPVNLQWGFDLKVVRPFIQAGPYWGFAVKKPKEWENWDGINRTDWGVGVGAGIDILNHLHIAFKYDWGLSNLNKVSDFSIKNNVFNISIGYMF